MMENILTADEALKELDNIHTVVVTKSLSQNAQVAVLNMPDLAWQNKTKIDYLRDEYLLAMCDENVILATLLSDL